MRIGLDATPLLGRRTGIGRYTLELVRGLAATGDDEVVLTAFTARGTRALRDTAPAGALIRSRRLPARLLRQLWQSTEFPTVGLSVGPVGVFHATNFVLPPPGRAAGVVTVHDLSYLHSRDVVHRASLAYRELVPRSIARACRVLTPSRAVADEVVATYGIDPARVVPVHLGVDPMWSRAQPDPGVARRLRLPERYVVAVGTVEPRKNLQTLVDAIGEAARQAEGAPHLVVIGSSGWGESLDLSRVPEGVVHATGYLEDDALASVVAGSLALAFPSRYEGFGLPPLEALACGRPVLVSDLPVMREVLGEHAAYLPATDTDAWATALGGLPGHDDDAAAARRAHAAGLSWQACVTRTRQVYAAALDERGAG